MAMVEWDITPLRITVMVALIPALLLLELQVPVQAVQMLFLRLTGLNHQLTAIG
jgi:hypothetical protein